MSAFYIDLQFQLRRYIQIVLVYTEYSKLRKAERNNAHVKQVSLGKTVSTRGLRVNTTLFISIFLSCICRRFKYVHVKCTGVISLIDGTCITVYTLPSVGG